MFQLTSITQFKITITRVQVCFDCPLWIVLAIFILNGVSLVWLDKTNRFILNSRSDDTLTGTCCRFYRLIATKKYLNKNVKKLKISTKLTLCARLKVFQRWTKASTSKVWKTICIDDRKQYEQFYHSKSKTYSVQIDMYYFYSFHSNTHSTIIKTVHHIHHTSRQKMAWVVVVAMNYHLTVQLAGADN